MKLSILSKILTFALIALTSIANPAWSQDRAASIKFEGSVSDGIGSRVPVDDIEAIGLVTETVYDPFDKVETEYAGVWLDSLAEHFGGQGVSLITTSAIDGYTVEWDFDYLSEYRVLIATRRGGERLTLETKGPLRVIFADYDENQTHFKETLPKWVWMITTIRFD